MAIVKSKKAEYVAVVQGQGLYKRVDCVVASSAATRQVRGLIGCLKKKKKRRKKKKKKKKKNCIRAWAYNNKPDRTARCDMERVIFSRGLATL